MCPFAHPGEKAKRRDCRVYSYTGIACPEMKVSVLLLIVKARNVYRMNTFIDAVLFHTIDTVHPPPAVAKPMIHADAALLISSTAHVVEFVHVVEVADHGQWPFHCVWKLTSFIGPHACFCTEEWPVPSR